MALDYESLAVSRLTGQFQDSPKLKALTAAIMSVFTTLENEADSLKQNRWIDSAVGKQMDGCGYIVGEMRKGRDDDAYRQAIKFRVFVNVSKGTPIDLIRGLKFLTSPTDSQYIEMKPATAILYTNGYFVPTDINAQINDLAPTAINNVPVCVSFGGLPFRFSKEPSPGELFANDEYLTAEGSDIQVSTGAVAQNGNGFGGAVPSDLNVTGGEIYLDVNGFVLAVYNPNTARTIGHNNLTGVYQ